MREREHFIDLAKAIGVFLVICGHYVYYMHVPINNGGMYLWNIAISITLFHMPLFFIISGYLYRTPDTWIGLITNTAKRLIIPYVLICVTALATGTILLLSKKEMTLMVAVHELIHNVCGIISGGDFPHTRMIFSGPMWFVYSLIIIRFVYYGMERLFRCIIYTHTHNLGEDCIGIIMYWRAVYR